MKSILFIDSAYDGCSSGIWSEESGMLGMHNETMRKGMAEAIMPMIKTTLDEGGLMVQDLSEIAVVVGPGRFTGIRLALSAAKSLALPFGLPVVGLVGTHIHAYRYFNNEGEGETSVIVALESGRGNFFVQYISEDMKKMSEIQDMPPEDIVVFARQYSNARLITDDVQAFSGIIDALSINRLSPQDMVELYRYMKQNDVEFAVSSPLYVRSPDVTQPKHNF